MSSNPTPLQDNRITGWPGVVAGLVIYLVGGLQLIVSELPLQLPGPAGLGVLRSLILWCYLLTSVAGFTLGWIKGFPRWSYPYVPMSTVLTLYIFSASTPGLNFLGYPTFRREIWGARAFIPLILGTGTALLITRSSQPVRRFFRQLTHDWTLSTYALSSTLIWVIYIAYDEIDHTYSIRDLIVLSLALLLMALLYLRSRTLRQRSLVVGIGIPLIIVYTGLSTTTYWLSLGPGNVYLPGMLIWMIVLVFFYLSPRILVGWRQSVPITKPEG